jgi:hypothetical protein
MRHEFTLSTIVEVDDAEIYIVETVRNNYEPYSLRVKEVNLENRIVYEEDLSWRVLRKEKKQRIDEEIINYHFTIADEIKNRKYELVEKEEN